MDSSVWRGGSSGRIGRIEWAYRVASWHRPGTMDTGKPNAAPKRDGDHHGHVAHHGHAHHGHHHGPPPHDLAFAIGAGVNLAFALTEAGFGFVTNSVALVADAIHNMGDVLGL